MNRSKIFEVYEVGFGNKRRLYTKSIAKSKSVYGENIFKEGNDEYREWNPTRSKLAAAILKGCSNIGIRKGDIVLYLGSSTGTTVSHVSDIIGNEGNIFAVDFAPRVMRDLVYLSDDRKNIIPIFADARVPKRLIPRITQVDVIYQDVAQRDQVGIFLKNCDIFLKKGGFGILCLKSRSIDVTKKPKDVYKETRKLLEKEIEIVDFKDLYPFEKDHAFFICKKR